jgi:hypothetical protein
MDLKERKTNGITHASFTATFFRPAADFRWWMDIYCFILCGLKLGASLNNMCFFVLCLKENYLTNYMPPVVKPLDSFPAFCGTRRFTAVFITAPPPVPVMSQFNATHTTSSYPS